MALKYSVYYRIQQRDNYFERFFKKFSKQFSDEIKEAAKDKYEELMEIIVQYILDENKTDLNILLTKQNAKVARIFFDYLTVSNIKNKKKCDIASRIDEIFIEEKKMINFKEFISKKLSEINLLDSLEKPERITLSEAEDEDPFADDADAGADEDPFADDADSDTSGGAGGSDGSDSEGNTTDGETDDTNNGDKPKDELDLENHEDDPDFTKGVSDNKDITLSDTPSGECIYDVEGVMKAIAAVIQGTNETDLEEIVPVKKAVELIFNGKILKPEDVQFTNTQNAAFLIKKIGEKVDEKTKNYLLIKIKEPLIKQRDQQKLDIAELKKDVNMARDTIQDLDQA
jgi:hypothetical protein